MLRMVSYSHRPKSGQITCYLNRTYHVLTTPSNSRLVCAKLSVYHRSISSPYLEVRMLGPRWVCVCIPVVLLASVAAQVVPQSVLSMPVRLELDKATAEVKRGGSVSYTVTLKNFQNQAVAAPRETQVEIVAPGYSHTLTISPGKSSETFEVPA